VCTPGTTTTLDEAGRTSARPLHVSLRVSYGTTGVVMSAVISAADSARL
jgi:hypothetical protein